MTTEAGRRLLEDMIVAAEWGRDYDLDAVLAAIEAEARAAALAEVRAKVRALNASDVSVEWSGGFEECRAAVLALLDTPVPSADEVWAAMEADPAFVEGMKQGLADVEAGRLVPWRHVAPAPSEPGLDVETLARALHTQCVILEEAVTQDLRLGLALHEPGDPEQTCGATAHAVAAEYARLREK